MADDREREDHSAHLCNALLTEHEAISKEVCCACNEASNLALLRQASNSSDLCMYIKRNGELVDAKNTMHTLEECLSTLAEIKKRLNDTKALLNDQVETT